MVAREEGGRVGGRRVLPGEEGERRAGHVLRDGQVVPWRAGRRERRGHALDSQAPGGHGGAHRDAERRLEPAQVEPDPPRLRLVVHVEDENGRHLELAELQGEQQRAAQVLGVGDLDDDRALFPAHGAHEVPGDLLVLAQRDERVEARGVDDLDVGPAEAAAVDLDGRAGVVRDGGPQAGERVEEGALAHVGVAEEDDAARGARLASATAAPACSAVVAISPSRPC